MQDEPRTRQQDERRALVADLVRTQAVLQARSEQLRRIFASRWYRLARFFWRVRRPWAWRSSGERPRMAGEGSFAEPLNVAAATAARESSAPAPGLEGPREAASPGGPVRLLLAGHSLSFATPIAERARLAGMAVRLDSWPTHGGHDEGRSAQAIAWADVVLCEWCLGNAVWYSRNKRPGQRLVVRFHRMELETRYPAELELERVDTMVFVAAHVLEAACARFGWDERDPRLRVVPNGIDAGSLARPKLPEAERTLAAIGYVPRLKRLDLMLDLLEELRARDERWRLLVKGREPWEHDRLASRQEEREHFAALAARLEAPGLRRAVELEPFGPDVPEFLRRAGWILSPSEVEGHSVALAEGMASGAVPVVLDRPGAAEQCEERWVHADVPAAAESILAVCRRGDLGAEGEAARRRAECWDWERLASVWRDLLLGREASAPAAGRGPGT